MVVFFFWGFWWVWGTAPPGFFFFFFFFNFLLAVALSVVFFPFNFSDSSIKKKKFARANRIYIPTDQSEYPVNE